MVSLVNGDGNNSGGYMFEDSDDADSATDRSPLVRQQPADDDTLHRHTHIITGYLSIFEVIVLLVYLVGGIVGLVNSDRNAGDHCANQTHLPVIYKNCFDKFLIGFMCMAHAILWLAIAVLDRIIQWQHQIIRRKGYLKFYRKMKNLRRIPFIMMSLGTAVLLIFVSVLYLFSVKDRVDQTSSASFRVKYFMFIIVGIEMFISIIALMIYIIQAVLFNIRRPPPDVIQDTASMANSPTATLTTVGFRDGEDLDELLERQADMIRYLQQHNASLGRRIMELQSRTIE
ncbi:PREDICTED: transmembrane protein 192-like isoform X2 [Amphimedon queenslandica]|uniref:Transmembrane protein 192 n=1 Tax=Amphimedon queenslandica TaxID=400682 RepID=A0A1X7UIT1_AMPQE|nr:PREDICTED: transmembrane protein 192-like isoform X2 [Amphimedon queenslandica]|eukprot:XP_003387777.1 PREDICTED: transmembrane protein 192-like isoform X2 [Amphimedon queenslandica]